MAALMRFSKFSGLSKFHCFPRALGRPGCSVVTYRAELYALPTGSALKEFRHFATAATAVLPRTNDVQSEEGYVRRPPRRFAVEENEEASQGLGGKKSFQREKDETLEEKLRYLDDQVRRWGRIDQEQVKELLQLVNKTADITTQQSVMLLRSTGTVLVKASPSERAALCNEAWKHLESAGAVINLQVYNAMLRVKLENGQTFSPAEVLSDIETKRNLIPNRVTYQLLIGQFCESGDLEGASKILEHMKSQNLSINESVFNLLIRGNVRKGDIAGAQEVQRTMSEMGLEPSAETYKTLLCSLAEKGDVAIVKQKLLEADKADIYLNGRYLFDVVTSFVLNKHEQHIDVILDYIKQKPNMRYNQDATNCAFQLVANGYDDAAFKVLLCLDRTRFESESNIGRVLLRSMIIKKRPVEKVMEMSKRMFTDKFMDESQLDDLALWGYTYQPGAYHLQILDSLKSQGRPMKAHYYWPSISFLAKAGDVKGIIDVVPRVLSASDKDLHGIIVDSLYPWAVRELVNRGQEPAALTASLKSAGVSDKDVQGIQLLLLTSAGKYEEAAKLVKAGGYCSTELMKAEIVLGLEKSKYNVTALTELLKSVSDKAFASGTGEDSIELNSSVLLMSLIRNVNMPRDVVGALIDAWIDKGLKLHRSNKNAIKSHLTSSGISEGTLTKMEDLYPPAFERMERLSIEDLKAADIAQLESWMERSVQGGQRNKNKTIQKWLLNKYLDEKMVEKAEHLKSELDGTGFIYDEFSLNRLGIMAARDKENLEEALTYCNELKARHPSFHPTRLTLNIVNLQLKNGKFDDAMKTLIDFKDKHGDALKYEGVEDGYLYADVCRQLIRSSGEHDADVHLERTKKLLESLFELGYLKVGTFSVIDELVSVALKKANSDSILSVLEYCVTKYNAAPQNEAIFRHFINDDDVDRLQTAVDLTSSCYGEMNVLLHLVFCFIECGKPKKARKIIETPGLRANTETLIIGCQRFINLDKEKELEQLVEISKSLYKVDRDEMLLQLMRFHAKRRDAKKLLEVFSLYEEEGLTPRDRTLRYVAKVLQSLNEPIPFDIPSPRTTTSERVTTQSVERSAEALTTSDTLPPLEVTGHSVSAKSRTTAKTTTRNQRRQESSGTKTQSRPVSSTNLGAEAQQAADKQDFVTLMKIKEQCAAEENGKTKSLRFVVDVVQYLQHNIGVLHRFLNELAGRGDVETLMALNQLNLSNELALNPRQAGSLKDCLFRAYVNGNKIDELVTYLKANPTRLPDLISNSTFDILSEKRRDLVPIFSNLVTTYTSSGGESVNYAPALKFFNHLLLTGDITMARQLIQNFPAMKERISPVRYMRSKKLNQSEPVLRELIAMFKDDSYKARPAYSSLILLKCKKGDWSEALACYKSGLADGLTFSDFTVISSEALQSLLESNKQPIPWTAEEMAKKKLDLRAKRQNVSDSDSSDSDHDNTKKS